MLIDPLQRLCNALARPTALGLVPGCIYLLALLVLLSITDLTTQERATYTAAMAILGLALLIGFLQDVLRFQGVWKAVLPGVVGLAIAVSSSGPLPKQWEGLMSITTHMELVYKAAIGLFTYAIITSFSLSSELNGLKAGQTYFISISLLVQSLLVLFTQELASSSSQSTLRAHFLSSSLAIPFLFVSFALLKHNKFPSSVSAGAVFSYFAGTSLALNGLCGAFSTLWMLLISPQIAHILLYLHGLVTNTKENQHLNGNYDPNTRLFAYSKGQNGLINYYLILSGPLDEETLVIHLYLLQALSGLHYNLAKFNVFSLLY